MKQKLHKTIKIPVSEKITRKKLEELDRLTARLTYGVQLFLERIIEEDITTRAEANKYNKEIQQISVLPSAYVQCCRDRALWMYKSYKRNHREWEKKVAKLEEKIEKCENRHNRRLERKLYRLKKREPSPPSVKGKIPVVFDSRVGSVEFSRSAREFRLWIRISTLVKGKRIDIPLHSYAYAERHLKWEIKSFQIVWRSDLKRYEVHVVVEKEVVVQSRSIAGIDLGLKRIVTVYETTGEENRVLLLQKEQYKEFFIRMRRLNNRIAKLQRLRKYRVLKRLRHKRRDYAEIFEGSWQLRLQNSSAVLLFS